MRFFSLLAFAAVASAASAQDLWRFSSFGSEIVAVDTEGQTGDSRGGLVMSGNNVHKTGDSQTVGYDKLTLGSASGKGAIYETSFYNVRDNQLYTFGTSSTTIANPGAIATHLLRVDDNYNVLGSVTLSNSLTLSSSASIYSGYDRVVFSSGGNAVRIDLGTGAETSLGGISGSENSGESWTNWGLVETWGGKDYLVSAESEDAIRRYDFDTDTWSDLVTGLDIDDASLAVDLASSSYYLGYEYGPGRNESLVRFNATVQTAPVPEPATMAALAGGIALMARRRRNKK